MEREAKSPPGHLTPRHADSVVCGQIDALADLLATGFIRLQKRRAKALDDVAHGGRVTPGQQGPLDGGTTHE
jgi:hypothetical protein